MDDSRVAFCSCGWVSGPYKNLAQATHALADHKRGPGKHGLSEGYAS